MRSGCSREVRYVRSENELGSPGATNPFTNTADQAIPRLPQRASAMQQRAAVMRRSSLDSSIAGFSSIQSRVCHTALRQWRRSSGITRSARKDTSSITCKPQMRWMRPSDDDLGRGGSRARGRSDATGVEQRGIAAFRATGKPFNAIETIVQSTWLGPSCLIRHVNAGREGIQEVLR